MLRFAFYLTQQGYKGSQITILSLYASHLLLLKQMHHNSYSRSERMAHVAITTVDSYQGLENDIVLVSLVRSNDQAVIGFLHIMNRVYVPLCRARYGMYLFGNKQCITKAALERVSSGGNDRTCLKVFGVQTRQ